MSDWGGNLSFSIGMGSSQKLSGSSESNGFIGSAFAQFNLNAPTTPSRAITGKTTRDGRTSRLAHPVLGSILSLLNLSDGLSWVAVVPGVERDNLIYPNSILALGRPTFGTPLGILGIRSPCSKRRTAGNMHDSMGPYNS